MTNQFEVDFLDFASSGATFVERLNNVPDDDNDAGEHSLRQAVQTFRNSLRQAPVPTSAPVDASDSVIPGDEDSEFTAKLKTR